MRLIACILAAFAAAGLAAAEDWKRYAYSAHSFSLAFPAEPKFETTAYRAPGGRVVQARAYSVTQAASVLRMTVVELKGAPVVGTCAIEQAVNALTQGGEVKLDVPHQVDTVLGRQLSIGRSDGSHSFVAVFYRQWRLYQIEGIALSSQGEADAIRFQQSLEFQHSLDFAVELSPRAPDVAICQILPQGSRTVARRSP
jgi:hypothetical protein